MAKKISIIVAIAEDFGIGKNNDLLAYVSDDLKRFKKITSGHTVIMGRNTYLSLPNGALPNRQNIVITDKRDESFDKCTMVHSIDEAIDACPDNAESFVIGGAMIYKQFYPVADRLYLTKFHKTFDADTFFPEIDMNLFRIIEEKRITDDQKANFEYSYITLERK